MAESRRYRAVLIGNATYPRDPHGLPDLNGPLTDIAHLRQALTDTHFGLFEPAEVEILPDRTIQDLRERVDDLFTSGARSDVLLLYYSGHGQLDERGTLYLCANDTKTTSLRATALSAIEINNIIDGSPATTTIVILDCCYSGAFKGTTPITPTAGRGRYVLTSGRATQLARAAGEPGRSSPFTQQLVRALCTAPAGKEAGHLTILEIYRQVHDWVTESAVITPQLRFEGEGDVALARRPVTPRPAPPHETGPRDTHLVGGSGPVQQQPPGGSAAIAAAPARDSGSSDAPGPHSASSDAPAPHSAFSDAAPSVTLAPDFSSPDVSPAAQPKEARPSPPAGPKRRAAGGRTPHTRLRTALAGRGATALAAAITAGVTLLLPTKPPVTVAQTATGDIVAIRCKPGDHFVDTYRDWVHDLTGGAAVFGGVCKDVVTTGYYWSVEWEDTAADGACAHAEASWEQDKGQAHPDYGMYLCGDGKMEHRYTPVRSAAQYSRTRLGTFIDHTGLNYGARYTL